MFEIYQRTARLPTSKGKWVSVGKRGLIQVSKETVDGMHLTKGHRHELYFDRDSHRIGIKFVSTQTDDSRAIKIQDSGSVQLDGFAFFRQFNLRLPAKSTRLTAVIDGDLIVVSYPDVLVPKAAK